MISNNWWIWFWSQLVCMKIGRLHQAISYFAQFEEITVNHWPVLLHLLRLNLTITTGQFLDSAFEHSATSHKTLSLEGVGFSAPWTSGSPMRKNGIMYEVLFFSRLLAEQQCKVHANTVQMCCDLQSDTTQPEARANITFAYNLWEPYDTDEAWRLSMIKTNPWQMLSNYMLCRIPTWTRRTIGGTMRALSTPRPTGKLRRATNYYHGQCPKSPEGPNRARCTFYISATHSG